ncbi:MAG: FAD-dependent oxidoreductase [Bacillota bacterium]
MSKKKRSRRRRRNETLEYDVVVIGGGPAGLTAAIYAGRAKLKTVVVEKGLIGGLATYTNEIANYPGFPEAPKGEDITNEMKTQAENMGVDFKLTAVKSVDLEGDVKTIKTFRTTYKAKTVIIATGGRPRTTGAKNEEDFLYDKGISFCATCDAAANQDKHVVVIGSGDAAIEEGMFLTKFAKKVTVSVLHDEGIMDCNEIAKNSALQNDKMEFLWNTSVKRFEGDDHLERVVLYNSKEDKEVPVECDNCFEFIGYVPNNELFIDKVKTNDRGYIPVDDLKRTNVEGVFAVGDITDKWLKQIATAVGDGAIAGSAAEKYIHESHVYNNEIMQKEKPGLIYVYNAIDEASRDLVSVIDEVSNDNLKTFKIDVYKSEGLAKRLNVEKYPALVLTENGEITKRVYDLDKEKIKSAVK